MAFDEQVAKSTWPSVLGAAALSLSLFAASLVTPAIEYEFDVKDTLSGWEILSIVTQYLWEFVRQGDSWDDFWLSRGAFVSPMLVVFWLPNPLFLLGLVLLIVGRPIAALTTSSMALAGAVLWALWPWLLVLTTGSAGPRHPHLAGYYLWVASILVLIGMSWKLLARNDLTPLVRLCSFSYCIVVAVALLFMVVDFIVFRCRGG